MDFLSQFRLDLKKATEDHQRNLVLDVIKKRARTLTFGDLRALLGSTLSKGIDEVRLASLFVPTAPDEKTATSKTKTKDPRSAKQRPRESKKQVSQATLDAVTKVLTAAGRTLSTTEIVKKTKLHRRTVLKALTQLRNDGLIEGSQPAKPETAKPATATKAPTPAEPVTPAKREGSNNTEDDRLDAAILGLLASSREPLSSTAIINATGANLRQVRAALQRQVSRGRVTRTGVARFTRYAASGEPQ